MTEATTEVEIDSVGTVRFSSSLSKEEIARLIKSTIGISPAEVRKVAESTVRESASRKAFEASEQNSESRRSNRTVMQYSFLVWFGFSVVLYLLGWSIAWVRRGFRAI
jgi:hypothetical protein